MLHCVHQQGTGFVSVWCDTIKMWTGQLNTELELMKAVEDEVEV